MAYVFGAVGGTVLFLAGIVARFDLAQVFAAGTLIFAGGETVAFGTQHLAPDRGDGLSHFLLAAGDVAHVALLGLGDEEVLVRAELGHHERRIRQLGEFFEAFVEHHGSHAHGILVHQVVHVALHLVRIGVVFPEEEAHGRRELLVRGHADDGLVIVLYRHVVALGRILRLGNRAEDVLDLGFDFIDIDVADHHDTLVVRAIPFLIIVAQYLVREVVHHLHQADRHALRILVARIDGREDLLVEAHLGVLAAAPLLVDHAALTVDVLRGQQQAVGPVMEDPQAGVDCARHGGHGHVVYIIYGLVDAGIGIQVSTEFHTDALAVFHHAIAREMLRAVEAHVLQEMGQTALVLVFQDGAHFLGDVEIGLPLRLLIVPDVVGQSVVKLADAHLRIDRDRRHLLGRCKNACAEGEGSDQGKDSFHYRFVIGLTQYRTSKVERFIDSASGRRRIFRRASCLPARSTCTSACNGTPCRSPRRR